MTPNQITVARVILALIALALFQGHFYARILGAALTILAIVLDAVDGYVARKRKLATPLGATLDILGDRIVENIYWIYFASIGKVSFWIPILFLVRGIITDFIRNLAMHRGKTAFGKNSMMETWWGKAIVGSRWSRGLYGALKCAAFCYLGLLVSLDSSAAGSYLRISAQVMYVLNLVALGLVYALAVLCLLRGLPVIWEGRRYLT